VANNARLATFDRRIQPVAINGGKEALEIIPVS
ncbi:MAG: VapC toxin family PIN domain ribonuclease, partial [Verrucomicrobia bacterium]|nr:VapC toxin family PIN domain ribonuclease [Verrucomicrobiota bacterium]